MARIAFNVTFGPSFNQINLRFKAAREALRKQQRESMRGLGRFAVDALRREAPKKTGKFAKAHSFKTFESQDIITLNVYIPMPLGRWIIEGTRAHQIIAHGRVLAFAWPKMGPGTFFFRRVYHPGTKPNPYPERAMSSIRPRAAIEIRAMGRAYADVVKGLSG